MCNTAIKLITKALEKIDNADDLLKTKGVIALFIQTMEGWSYSVTALDNFLLVIFDKYAELLKKRFSDDFEEVCKNAPSLRMLAKLFQIVSSDDYMPMPVADYNEYDKVLNVSWFEPEKPREELTCVLPIRLRSSCH